MAVEEATGFRGLYFVLMGHLSPLDGIGPAELGLDSLDRRLADGGISELIIATNPTVEGDATALYLARLLEPLEIRVTRLAHGISVGTEIEYADAMSLARALQNRTEFR